MFEKWLRMSKYNLLFLFRELFDQFVCRITPHKSHQSARDISISSEHDLLLIVTDSMIVYNSYTASRTKPMRQFFSDLLEIVFIDERTDKSVTTETI